jgi:hypothetical protein
MPEGVMGRGEKALCAEGGALKIELRKDAGGRVHGERGFGGPRCAWPSLTRY